MYNSIHTKGTRSYTNIQGNPWGKAAKSRTFTPNAWGRHTRILTYMREVPRHLHTKEKRSCHRIQLKTLPQKASLGLEGRLLCFPRLCQMKADRAVLPPCPVCSWLRSCGPRQGTLGRLLGSSVDHAPSWWDWGKGRKLSQGRTIADFVLKKLSFQRVFFSFLFLNASLVLCLA